MKRGEAVDKFRDRISSTPFGLSALAVLDGFHRRNQHPVVISDGQTITDGLVKTNCRLKCIVGYERSGALRLDIEYNTRGYERSGELKASSDEEEDFGEMEFF